MKKPSERRASRSPPDPLTYFSDRDLAKRFPRIVRAAGVDIVGYHDPSAYPGDDPVSDREWIAMACGRGFVCLTHDSATRRDEEDTLDEVFREWQHSGALFILRGGVSTERLAAMFLEVRPRIERMVRRQRRRRDPFIGVVRRAMSRGAIETVEVELWADRAKWQAKKDKRRKGR